MVFPQWLNAIGVRPGGTAPMVVRPGGTAPVRSPPVPVVRSSLTTSTSPASPPVDLVRGTTIAAHIFQGTQLPWRVRQLLPQQLGSPSSMGRRWVGRTTGLVGHGRCVTPTSEASSSGSLLRSSATLVCYNATCAGLTQVCLGLDGAALPAWLPASAGACRCVPLRAPVHALTCPRFVCPDGDVCGRKVVPDLVRSVSCVSMKCP